MSHSQPSSAQVERDRDYVTRIRAGDYDAFVAVFRAYYGPAREFAGRLLRDEDAAEDVVQDVFFTIWRRRETWVVTSSLASYIYGAVRNRAVTQLRHRRVRARLEGFVRGALDRAVPRPDADALAIDLDAVVRRAIDRLPRRCREVYELRWYHQLSYVEIAHMLSISVKTVEAHVAMALKVLRAQIRDLT